MFLSLCISVSTVNRCWIRSTKRNTSRHLEYWLRKPVVVLEILSGIPPPFTIKSNDVDPGFLNAGILISGIGCIISQVQLSRIVAIAKCLGCSSDNGVSIWCNPSAVVPASVKVASRFVTSLIAVLTLLVASRPLKSSLASAVK
ncbi:hypothetical protein ICE98_02580 [Lactococcus lactis]|nr:hypothetical protein [Lactococcus lactis]